MSLMDKYNISTDQPSESKTYGRKIGTATFMALFVIPIANAAIPSVLFKFSELALATIASNLLAIIFSATNDFEGYAILQSPTFRQLAMLLKIARTRRVRRALTLLAVIGCLLSIGFYNTLLWSLIDTSGLVHATHYSEGLNLDDSYTRRFWGMEVNGSVKQEDILAQITPGLGSGYAILSNNQAFTFDQDDNELPLFTITENSIYFNMSAGAYTQVMTMANNAEGNCTRKAAGKYGYLQKCARDSNDGGLDAAIDWSDLNRGRVAIYVSPPGTDGLTGDISLNPQGSTQFISTTYADSVEGLWGQIALDEQVLTFTHIYNSQTREYAAANDSYKSPICTKVLGLSKTSSSELIDMFSSVNGPASLNYHWYDAGARVIHDACIFKTTNISAYAAGHRGNLTFCAYSETRLSLLPSGNVMKLPGYRCEAQSFSQGSNGVETFSQCEDGGFGDVPSYKVRANIDASIVLSQPYAFRLHENLLTNSDVWNFIPKSLFNIAITNVPKAYHVDLTVGRRLLYGRFYGYTTKLAIFMFLPLVLAPLMAIGANHLAEDAYFASLAECLSTYTDPTAGSIGVEQNPTKARYRRLTRVKTVGRPIQAAFDGVEIVAVEKVQEVFANATANNTEVLSASQVTMRKQRSVMTW